MAGRGPQPKPDRVRRAEPERGEAQVAAASQWSHGEIPPAPDGLMPASVEAWTTWFGAWFAAFWTPADLPALRQMIRLYDQVERGEFQRASELRLQMDTYGVTPKGQQDRRWKQPIDPTPSSKKGGEGRYSHLKAI